MVSPYHNKLAKLSSLKERPLLPLGAISAEFVATRALPLAKSPQRHLRRQGDGSENGLSAKYDIIESLIFPLGEIRDLYKRQI